MQELKTVLEWSDLVLDTKVLEQLNAIVQWEVHRSELMEGWRLKPLFDRGARVLFWGPPGTGKTLSATLIGRHLGTGAWQGDARHILGGDANAEAALAAARNALPILVFDETGTPSGGDRAANQQTAHLLQKLEDYPGIVIVASNLRASLDDAFARRFQSTVHFGLPDAERRALLWRNLLSAPGLKLAPDVDFGAVARDFALSGGAILNAVPHALLSAAARDPLLLMHDDLVAAARREAAEAAPIGPELTL